MIKVQRNLEVTVQNLLRDFPIVTLIGARQVGKTELAKKVCPSWKYFDLENFGDLERIRMDPDFFFQENSQGLILDEAQECPEIFKILRGVVDRDRGKKGRFILTGSSSPELMKQVSESLAGRVALVEVGTLKANEFYEKPLSPFYSLFENQGDDVLRKLPQLTPQLSVAEVRSFWFHGGYPEPSLARNASFYQNWMEQYQKTYIERDIRKLFPRINSHRYQKFISILAELSGTIINRSELAALIEVSQPTISHYLAIADGTLIWRTLPGFSRSKSKSLVKMPKGHLRDSGLHHFLAKSPNLESLLRTSIFGRSFEAFVIEEILKGLAAAGITNWNYYFYRTRSRAEIDLILDGNFGLIPIEIKFSSKVEAKDLRHLHSFMEEYKSPLGLLVNQSMEVQRLSAKVIQVPVGLL